MIRVLAFVLSFVLFSSVSYAAEIVISLRDKTLTYYTDHGYVYEYPIAVPKAGAQWTGTEIVTNKRKWPTWTPTENIRKIKPHLPQSVPPGPDNPLGARALYLGDTLYRIHGTNDPKSIGSPASRGCFRMINEHVVELYEMVEIGTPVHVY
jgi:lipoprotein-anchoring transpeptidase ErfK/SrfK